MAVPDRFLHIVASIEQYSDLDNMSLDEAIGRLKTFEDRLKCKKERQPNSQERLMFSQHDSQGKSFRAQGNYKGKSDQENNYSHYAKNYTQKNPEEDQSNLIEEDLEPTLLMATIEEHHEVFLEIKGKGSILLECKNKEQRAISKVYYIPNLKSNILSLGQLTENGCKVVMEKNILLLYDSNGNILLRVTRSKNKLYKANLRIGEPTCLLANLHDEAWLWHARLGHLNIRSLKSMTTKNLVQEIPSIKHLTDICDIKHARTPFPRQAKYRSKTALDLIYGDLCGPILPPTPSGKTYIFFLVDDYSGYMWEYFLNSKDQAFGVFKKFKTRVKKEHGTKIKTFRTDRGGEFTSNEFHKYCRENGIIRQLTAPYSPQQNGVVERKNRTILSTTRCMMKATGTPQKFWAEAVRHAILLLNCTPTKSLEDVTSYEALKSRKPNLQRIRKFGCIAYAKEEHVKDFDPKEPELRDFIIQNNKTQETEEVQQDQENKIKDDVFTDNENEETPSPTNSPPNTPSTISHSDTSEYIARIETIILILALAAYNKWEVHHLDVKSAFLHGDLKEEVYVSQPDGFIKTEDKEKVYRLRKALYGLRQAPRACVFKEFKTRAEKEHGTKIKTFRTYRGGKFTSNEFHKYCRENGIIRQLTAPYSPQQNGVIERKNKTILLTTRCMMKATGMPQNFWVEAVRHAILLLNCTPTKSLEDVTSYEALKGKKPNLQYIIIFGCIAFAKEEVYVSQPDGFIKTEDKGKVYRLRKALYGLRQALRAWYTKLDKTLKLLNFKKYALEQAVYTRTDKMSTLLIGVYVDDLRVTGTSKKEIESFKYQMQEQFEMSDLGLLTHYLGIEEPQEQHMKAIKQVLRYIKGTKDYGITYGHDGNKIQGYSDSSYGVNTQEGKGTTGIVFYFGNSPITWSTQKQGTLALSSCESEFIASATQALWLKRLLSKITDSNEEKIIIYVDNKSAIALMINPVFHRRSKYIDTKYHFIRECVEKEDLTVEHISGEQQRADILTKALPRIRFVTMRQILGVKNLLQHDQD
nr:zinc finger, CCHC-type [Tanacetum cinerariifolium]